MTQAFGLYTHIQSNRRRSAFLLGALFALVYALAFAGALLAAGLQYDWGLPALLEKAGRDTLASAPWITLGVGAWVWFAWKFNQRIIALAVPAQGLTRTQAPELYAMVENLCISRGMSAPKLAILESPAPNAFASGVNDAQYTITFTRGLLDLLEPAELEAVAAHELTHIRNEDVRMMVVAMVIAGVVSFFAELLFRMLGNGGFRWSRPGGSDSREDKGKGGGAAAIAIALLIVAAAWALSLMIRLALSRSREFMADAGSVELTKNPDAMISALRKISGKGEIDEAPSGVMEMCLDNPRSGFADLFSSHPPIEDRIDALVRYAGGQEALKA
ncbi:MAG: peptidase Ste24p [Hyphomicrobiales bacterium]|nr:peptidase Ste24p [Hyphomicrobiales bacterium]